MYIKFKYLKFKNILSYGNQLTEVPFTNGLHLINGKNGHGKSCLIEALFFCLFGQPYRKININQLVNRKNKGKLYTECAFSINNKEYVIIRTLLPNKISIFENGKEFDLLSSKKLVQEEINRLLGIDPNLFRQVICLAVNYNKPFLSLPSNEKRDIAESIFNIKVFGDMMKILRKNSSGLKVQSEINKKSLHLMESNLLTIRDQIKTLTKTSKDFENEKQAEIDQINARINELNIQNNTLKSQNESIRSNIPLEFLDQSAISYQISLHKQKLSVNKFQIDQIKENIDLLEFNDTCTFCKCVLTPEHKARELANFALKVSTLNDDCEQINFDLETLEARLRDEKKKEKFKIESLSTIEKNQQICEFNSKEIQNLLLKKNEVESKTINLNLGNMNAEFEKRKSEYSSLYAENRELNNKVKNHNIISDILSDTGIKTFFLKKMIPLFNSKINEYLSKFELPIQVIFNESMDETIRGPGYDSEISYFSFSEGEKKRIDIAILFSFIEMTKVVCNWNCNILIMDEIMDSATDIDGLDKMLYSIKNMTYANNQLGIYMISHRVDDNYRQLYDSIITAQKNNGFSRFIFESP